VFQTPLLENSQVGILPGWLLDFAFRQAKVKCCQMPARQVICKIGGRQTDGAVLEFH
jgi:hypothetical protein